MSLINLKIRSRDIQTLLDIIRENNPDENLTLVLKAYETAERAHENQTRLSGEPYIIHPLEVAIILAKLKLDTATIAAALLHDTVEDTGITLDVISREFSEDVALLVDGVTKISSIKNRSKATAQAETLRKMLIATIKDVRVIIIKLADKLHNMRTLMFQPEEKQQRIAKETMDIYAPMARRLGMSQISSELEDLAFRVLFPEEYQRIEDMQTQRKTELEEYLANIHAILISKLEELGIECEITGRAKHYWSIFKKMQQQNKTFDDIYDIRAVRIITSEVKDCYGILGVIHTLWSPIASRFKDYIAVPKSNLYRSLHTTVIGPGGFPLEVQIRTHEMHITNEMGIAAHWLYKEHPTPSRKDYKDLSLLQNINKIYADSQDTREFMKGLKMDLVDDEIFVFTPKGKIIKLPQNATPVDFAYAIHSEIGDHTTGAKVNNKMVPLRTRLKGGDIVEIFTSTTGHPSEAWMKFVQSTRARYRIRAWLRKNAAHRAEDEGKSEVEKEKTPSKTASVHIPEQEHLKIKKFSPQARIGVRVDGASDVLIRLSQCCQPIPGDDVIGFITRGRGITIHKKNCPSLRRLMSEKERLINIVWEGDDKSTYPVKLAVSAMDRQNLLKDIADEISQCKTNILKAEVHAQDKHNANFKFILEVRSQEHLKEIMSRIKRIRNVTDVYKLNEKVIL